MCCRVVLITFLYESQMILMHVWSSVFLYTEQCRAALSRRMSVTKQSSRGWALRRCGASSSRGVPYSGVGREDCWLFFLKHFVIFLSLSRTAWHSRVVSRQRVDDRGIMALFPSGTNHPNRPDRPWSPPSLLNNEYWELWVRRL